MFVLIYMINFFNFDLVYEESDKKLFLLLF